MQEVVSTVNCNSLVYGESFKLGVQGIASFADMLLRP